MADDEKPQNAEPLVKYDTGNSGAGEKATVAIRSPAKNRYKDKPLLPEGVDGKVVSRKRPLMFERAASSWWDPKFDSPVLEDQYKKNYFRLYCHRFQFALIYILIVCIAWAIYFGLMGGPNWAAHLAVVVTILVISLVVLGITFAPSYPNIYVKISIVYSILLCAFVLLSFVAAGTALSPVGAFTSTVEIILLMYTIIPLPLYVCVIVGVIHSAIFELLSAFLSTITGAEYIVGRILMHICIQLIGIHIYFMSQARKRSTFLKVGQSMMLRQKLKIDKAFKQDMIHSLMPKSVAASVMKTREDKDREEELYSKRPSGGSGSGSGSGPPPPGPQQSQQGSMKFRDFHMSQMDNVSILFADIVGFTKMSSNKTAEHLVSLLNDLFGRFDILCKNNGCEKISTLGDCYYCVSGCPEAREDHAQCCIEMGLGMCRAIQAFDKDHNESVNMRVGVHTGTVLCGIVGTRRFKFDVWSNDVTLANMMESEGEQGRVHISESTLEFVKNDYEVTPAKEVPDHQFVGMDFREVNREARASEAVNARRDDIRKHKVLIEDYNAQTQQYQVRHIQEQTNIITYFIVGRKPSAQSGSQSPQSPKSKDTEIEIPSTESPPVSSTDLNTVKIVVDEPTDESQELSDEVAEKVEDGDVKHEANHVEGSTQQTDANGVSAAILMGQRENMTASLEELAADEARDIDSKEKALLSQITTQGLSVEQTDKQMVAFMNETEDVEEYLHRPPINQCTLNFLKSSYENWYRIHYVAAGCDKMLTLASPRVSALCDLSVSSIFLILISASCFIGFPIRGAWIGFFTIALIFDIIVLVVLILDMVFRGKKAWLVKMFNSLASWYPRHALGLILTCLPVAAVLVNTWCDTFNTKSNSDIFFSLLFIVSLLHFCNFTMLSSWLKSSMATVSVLVLIVLIAVGICKPVEDSSIASNVTVDYGVSPGDSNIAISRNVTSTEAIFTGQDGLRYEIILNAILLLLLIWFLNREFEISYRLGFHGDLQAELDQKKMKQEKEQADWLLHNIIPEHVADVLKATSKYSKNHEDVGVVFAKVINFDDFYDESFEGGREYYRVLNELISDMEDLFDDPRFKDVEKIKTIGSCLMVASGLRPTRSENEHPDAHLFSLMEFSLELLKKLDQFNAEIFNFDFEMAIGFNFGEVTAGVIGTTKLLYDIWGDTVNISSRMYSTGMAGRIQVTEDVANRLGDMFTFEYRGQIFVKGKGEMNTYLLVDKKEEATWN